jgi:hypothetical protein
VFDSLLFWHFYHPDLPKSLADMAAYVLAGRSCYWKGLDRDDARRWKTSCEWQWEQRAYWGALGFESQFHFYNAIDVVTMGLAWFDLVADVQQQNRFEYYKVIQHADHTFWEMENGGLRIDRVRLSEHKIDLIEKESTATYELLNHPMVKGAVAGRVQTTAQDLALLQEKHKAELEQANAIRVVKLAERAVYEERLKGVRSRSPEAKRLRDLRESVKIPRQVKRSQYSEALTKAKVSHAKSGTLLLNGKQKLWLVYDALKMPKQFVDRKRKYGRSTRTLSASKDCLLRLKETWAVAQGDRREVLDLLINVQHYNHLLSTFASLKVESNDHIYPRIGIRTASGRASSGADDDEKGADSVTNIQNWPKGMRDVVVPDAGQTLVQWDYVQEEWLINLWEAGDFEGYGRTIAGEDRHAMSACVLFGTTMDCYTAESIAANPAYYAQRKAAKTMNYGMAYGMGAKKFALTNNIGKGKKQAEAVAEASVIMAKLRSAYPKVSYWQEKVLLPAMEKQKYLMTAFGWKRMFYRPMPNRALALVPSATGSGMMHYRIAALAALVKPYGGRLLTSTHDSFLASVPPHVAEKLAALGAELLSAPFPQMNGFACPVDYKIGKNWKEVS